MQKFMPEWLSDHYTDPSIVSPDGSVVERVLGKNEVVGPIPTRGSVKFHLQ